VLLLIVYISYLYFQLISHNDLFLPATNPDGTSEREGESESEDPALTVTAELSVLLAISVVVAMASECALHPSVADRISSRQLAYVKVGCALHSC
jgi:Ca2+/H+ antiporter